MAEKRRDWRGEGKRRTMAFISSSNPISNNRSASSMIKPKPTLTLKVKVNARRRDGTLKVGNVEPLRVLEVVEQAPGGSDQHIGSFPKLFFFRTLGHTASDLGGKGV